MQRVGLAVLAVVAGAAVLLRARLVPRLNVNWGVAVTIEDRCEAYKGPYVP